VELFAPAERLDLFADAVARSGEDVHIRLRHMPFVRQLAEAVEG